MRIEDYGLIGNTHTAALISREGSMDWLCLPTFDDGACFAALLGDAHNGCWKIYPSHGVKKTSRCYRTNTAILETTFETDEGCVTLTDFMPIVPEHTEQYVHVVRLVKCTKGQIKMHSHLTLRFDYGHIIPWLQKNAHSMVAMAGPDAIYFHTSVPLYEKEKSICADFTLTENDHCYFCLTWFASHLDIPAPLHIHNALSTTQQWWERWTRQANNVDIWQDAVLRSLITLKMMTFSSTGAIIAAPTTSLPEYIGGERNWDYRYCWIRDSTLTLYAFLISGFQEEAKAWRRWLLRATAGEPSALQIMYGLRGERRLTEFTIDWLNGYENSKPVRIGNQAHVQIQLDVYGELMDTMHVARKFDLEIYEDAWELQIALIRFIETAWDKPDYGIWEVRGPAQHFTHSKIMAWVAVDRAIKAIENFSLEGPLEEWKKLRQRIHADVITHGFSTRKGCFTQTYGGEQLDAALLLMAQLGFIAPDDNRFIQTVNAIEKELLVDGFVLRYRTDQTNDGLPKGEGVFLACSFWLVDAYTLMDRYDDAVTLFNRLLNMRNDIGLLSEEYDLTAKRQLGNFPQAFSHIALINSAHNLMSHKPPAKDRADGKAGHGKIKP